MEYKKEIEEIWRLASDQIRPSFSDTSFTLWFSELSPVDLTENKFIFEISSDFKKDIIVRRHADVIESSLEEVLGYPVEVVILSTKEAEIYRSTGGQTPPPYLSSDEEKRGESPLSAAQMPATEYTFDNFIVGSSNKFAHAACLSVAQCPASAYNPLFIWGPSGIGKTHLMYAILNEIKRSSPQLKCIYVKGEEFTNQVVDAIRYQNTYTIRNKYRTVDVLIIDDIQFIAGKVSTQEEFFHTFDSLFVDNKQIIITSDRPPKEMKTLEDRLKGRFESGLIADIQPPDIELRMAIIKNKAAAMHIDIPNDAVTYMADKLKNNVRQIEGALKKVGALSLLTGTPITLEIARRSVADIITDSEPSSVTVDKIFSAVSLKYKVPIEDIKSRKRSEAIANARHICVYLIRTLTDLSHTDIGMLFSRDHSTAMSSLRKIEKKIAEDTSFEAEISELISDIKEPC